MSTKDIMAIIIACASLVGTAASLRIMLAVQTLRTEMAERIGEINVHLARHEHALIQAEKAETKINALHDALNGLLVEHHFLHPQNTILLKERLDEGI